LGLDGRGYRHGIWDRAPFGVSTCSNHAERFHRTVNKRTAGLSLLLRRLSILVDCINEKFDRYTSGCRRQLKYVLKQLKARRAPQVPFCTAPRCEAFRNMMRAQFGVPAIPCKHQAADFTVADAAPAPIVLMAPARCQIETIGQRKEWSVHRPDTRRRVSRKSRTDLQPPKALPRDPDEYIVQLTRELMVLLRGRVQRDDRYRIIIMINSIFPRDTDRTDWAHFRARFRTASWRWALASPEEPIGSRIPYYGDWMMTAMEETVWPLQPPR
jgi:hypothetical protein